MGTRAGLKKWSKFYNFAKLFSTFAHQGQNGHIVQIVNKSNVKKSSSLILLKNDCTFWNTIKFSTKIVNFMNFRVEVPNAKWCYSANVYNLNI